MNILPRFQFKSLTHRLIFACVIVIIVIYSISFWYMHQVVQQGVVTWMTYVAQSRLDTVAAEVTGILRSIEQNAYMVVHSQEPDKYTSSKSFLPLLQTLGMEQSIVQGVAVRLPSGLFGIESNRQGAYQTLGADKITRLLTRCQNKPTALEPFWTKPYGRNPSGDTLAAAYCVPLGKTQKQITPDMLAIEINLGWLKEFVTSKLQIADKFNNLNIGKPFVFALPTRQWLVSPTVSIQNLSWFSPEHSSKLASDSIWRLSSFPKIIEDSQGILVFTTLPSTSWTFGIAFSNSELGSFEQKYQWLIVESMLKDMVLMCVAIAIVSQQTTRPLRALITVTEEIAQGNLDTVLPVITGRDEVGRLARAFSHMRDALKTQIEQLQETTAAKQKMESEIAIAGQIQYAMLPKIAVTDGRSRRYELSALLEQARIVGGDLYDFFLIEDASLGKAKSDRLCIVIGDVADKGIPAALLMARTVTLLRTIAKQTSTPIETLSVVNRELCINNEDCLFVTVFCGVLELNTGILTYASAGHDPPLLVRDGRVQFLNLETGPPLGLDEDAIFPQCQHLLQPKDLILLYTDGITEAMNPQGELFSETGILNALVSYPPSNPARAIRTVQHFHRQFVRDAPQSDDLTLLALQYQPSSPFSQEVEIVELIVTVNSELTELEKVKQRLGEILQAKGFAVASIEDAQLIVEEVLVNIIEHGYGEQCHEPIDLQVKISPDSLMMTFEDRGKPFNPLTEISAPDLSMDDEERSLGGLGFYLVRELADRIDYNYRDGKNILTIFQAIAKKA